MREVVGDRTALLCLTGVLVSGFGTSAMWLTAQGAGSVTAGPPAGPLLRRLPARVFAAAGTALFTRAAAARALPFEAVALAASAAIGLGLPCVLVAALTAVQREASDVAPGRTATAAHTPTMVPDALGLALGAGPVAVADVRLLLPSAAPAGLVTAVWPGAGRQG